LDEGLHAAPKNLVFFRIREWHVGVG
jgi:hypothetical protein